MKNRFLLIPALLLGATALGGAAIAGANDGLAKQAKAEELSPWTITEDMYEVALLESYSHHDHYLDHSKYMLGDWLNGNGEQKNLTVDLKMGIAETPNQWKFNLVRGYLKGGTTRYVTQLRGSNSSGTYNICNTTQYPQADYPDEYAIGQFLTEHEMTYGGAMISVTAYKNITDLSFYWRYTSEEIPVANKRVYIMYQLDGETEWKRLEGSSSANGNYTGTRGWDTFGYTTFNDDSWTTRELYGKTARVALVLGGKSNCDMHVGGVLINANNAAVRYLNVLSYYDGLCDSSSALDLNKGQTDSACNQDVFQLATERAEGSFLGNYICAGTKTSEYYILGLYNHFVTSVPGLGSVKAANSNFFNKLAMGGTNVALIASVSIAAAAVIGTGLLFGLKKRKHN